MAEFRAGIRADGRHRPASFAVGGSEAGRQGFEAVRLQRPPGHPAGGGAQPGRDPLERLAHAAPAPLPAFIQQQAPADGGQRGAFQFVFMLLLQRVEGFDEDRPVAIGGEPPAELRRRVFSRA